jgi:hypothetical protein
MQRPFAWFVVEQAGHSTSAAQAPLSVIPVAPHERTPDLLPELHEVQELVG